VTFHIQGAATRSARALRRRGLPWKIEVYAPAACPIALTSNGKKTIRNFAPPGGNCG